MQVRPIQRFARARWLFGLALLVTAEPVFADSSTSAPLPPAVAKVGIDEHLGTTLPRGLTFRDHTGQTVQLDQYFDGRRPVLLNLMYHRCTMLCSLVLDALTTGLRGVEWTAGKQFTVVTISIDPRDGPDIATRKRQQILARYGRSEAYRGWHFLTGSGAQIERLASALGFRYRWDPAQQQYAHPAAIFLLSPSAKIARYLYGIQFAPEDLRFGLLEASEGRTVTTLERVLLFCYHYDATGRRYTIVITRSLRTGGVLLLLLMGGLLARLWFRERLGSPPKSPS